MTQPSVEELVEFIRYWSYCTRQGMLKYCPEKKREWLESMKKLCPAGVVELSISDFLSVPQEELEFLKSLT